jgi:hypothetical protein
MASGFRTRFAAVTSYVGQLLKRAAVVGGAAVAALAIKSIDAAATLGESINKANVVFRDSAKQLLNWSKTTANSLGISRTAALEAAAGFGNMLLTSGVAEKSSAGMSKALVKLAADMASLNNEDPSDMLERFRSGLAGEAEPLRRFGVLLSETRVAQEAVRLGLAKQGDALTDAEKVQARYSLILKDTTKAHQANIKSGDGLVAMTEKVTRSQGDFAKTSNSLPNLQRRFKESVEDLSASLGKKLLPIATQVTKWALDKLPGAFDFAEKAIDSLSDTASDIAGDESFQAWFKDAGSVAKTLGSTMIDVAKRALPVLQEVTELAAEHKGLTVGVVAATVAAKSANNVFGGLWSRIGDVTKLVIGARLAMLAFHKQLGLDPAMIQKWTSLPNILQAVRSTAFKVGAGIALVAVAAVNVARSFADADAQAEKMIETLDGSKKTFDDFEKHYLDLGKTAGNATSDLKDELGALVTGNATATQELDALAEKADKLRDSFGSLTPAARKIAEVQADYYDATVKAGRAAADLEDVESAWIKSSGDVEQQRREYSAALDELRGAENRLRSAMKLQTLATAEADTAAEGLLETRRRLAGLTDDVATAELDARQAHRDLADAQRELTRLEDKGITKGREHAEAVDAVRRAEIALNEAQRRVADSTKELVTQTQAAVNVGRATKTNFDQLAKTFGLTERQIKLVTQNTIGGTEQLRRYAEKAGISKRTTDLLVAVLAQVQDKMRQQQTETDKTAGRTEAATGKTRGFIDALKDVPSRVVSVVKTEAADALRTIDAVKKAISGITRFVGIDFDATGDGPGAFALGSAGGKAVAMARQAIAAVPGAQAITSTYRSPAANAAADGSPNSYHLDRANPAADIGGVNLFGIFQYLATRFGGTVRELIYAHNMIRGGIRSYYAPSDHFDHVHVADMGKIVRGPATILQGNITEAHVPLTGPGADRWRDAFGDTINNYVTINGPGLDRGWVRREVYHGIDDARRRDTRVARARLVMP